MKDTIVKEGYWAYMLRVDCPKTDNEWFYKDFDDMLKWFHEWKVKYNCVYHIVGHEYSAEGKAHLQSIVWFESEQDKSKLRNWWKTRSANTKQAVAFTSAKKVRNLAKYSMKDNNYVTNLHNEEIKRIGKWETANQRRVIWTEKLQLYAEKVAKNYKQQDEIHQQGSYWIKQKFLNKMLDFYKENYKRPNRVTLQYLLWKYNLRSNQDLLEDWKLL